MKIDQGACHPANFTKGRPMHLRPEAIVLHTAMGSLKGLELQYKDAGSSMSAHYGIDAKGEIRQFVEETDTAFHAGIVDRPQWPLLKPRINPNYYTIGISFAGLPTENWTLQQYESAAALIASIGERWGIAVDDDHVIAHQRIRASKACPGDSVNIADLIARAATAPFESSRIARAAQVRTVVDANLRVGAPSTNALIARKIAAGTSVSVAGFLSGEKVRGNSCWYMDGTGNFLWAGATDTPQPAATGNISTDEMELTGEAAREAPEAIAIDRTKFALPRNQYHDEVTAKDLIVLHFTAGGSARSAFNAWASTPERVATAYLVDADGAIYETFDPSRWAPHLGIRGTHRHDRRSIGIEIANVGPLRPSPDDSGALNWWPPNQQFQQAYCKLSESGKYVKADYRTFEYYASFPEHQVEAVANLVEYLCGRFDIPRRIAPETMRFECDLAFFDTFQGITTHANFRRDKYDVGPAFDWTSLNAR